MTTNTTDSIAIEATQHDFQQVVIEKSMEVPVLVDFWAPWCQPCHALSPTLEKLAAEYKARFQLVKVNIDENPQLAEAVQIQSIPTVVLVQQGQLLDQFMGNLSEPQVRQFLDAHIPPQTDISAEQAIDWWFEGMHAEALNAFTSMLANEPKNSVALLGMALQAFEQGEVDATKAYLTKIAEVGFDKVENRQRMVKIVNTLKAKLYFVEQIADDVTANRSDFKADPLAEKFQQACQNVLAEKYEHAQIFFLNLVGDNREFKEDAGRKALLAMIDLLPEADSRRQTWRNQLSNLLFQ